MKIITIIILTIVFVYTFIFYGPIYILGISAEKLGWGIYNIKIFGLTSGKISALTSLFAIILITLKNRKTYLILGKFYFRKLSNICKYLYSKIIINFNLKYRSENKDLGGVSRSILIVTWVMVVFISTILGFISYEVYIRIKILNDLKNIRETATIWLQDNTLTMSPWDEQNNIKSVMHPRGLFKTNTSFNITVLHPTLEAANFSVKTNNVGLLSENNYEFTRNPLLPEYRIVLLGDSMTGPTTSTYQWADTLEELLNSNAVLRSHVKNKEFKIYNLGWIGAGFNSFSDAYKKTGRYFDPDLVVLNYIEIDLERLPKGVLIDKKDKVDNAMMHLSNIMPEITNFTITLMPTYNELMDPNTTYEATHMLEKSLNKPIAIMKDKMPGNHIPEEVESWFDLPYDAHYSDRGGEIYSRVLASHIAKHITGKDFDFTNAKSKYGDQLLPSRNTRLRNIEGPLSQLGKNKEAVSYLKNKLYGREIHSKVFATDRLYSFKTIKGEKFGAQIPYDKLIGVSGFEEFKFENNNISLNLLLACVKEPITIDNPDCYHHRHFFLGSNKGK